MNEIQLDIPPWAVAFVVALIGLLGAFSVQRYVAFRTASVKFRSSLLAVLAGLYPHPVRWPQNDIEIEALLKGTFPALQAAAKEFRDSLPWWQRRAFDAAWLRYCCSTGRDCDVNTYLHYIPMHAPGEKMPDVKKLFLTNVSNLLSFALYK